MCEELLSLVVFLAYFLAVSKLFLAKEGRVLVGVSVSDESVLRARGPSAFLNVSFELEVSDGALGIQLVC